MGKKNTLTWKDALFCSGDYRTKFLKIIDYYIGGLFCVILKTFGTRKAEFNKNAVYRILIIRPGGIGDAVLLTPFIKEINDIFRNATIDMLIEKRNAEVFSLLENKMGSVFYYDNLIKLPFIFYTLKKNNYDIIFDTEQWHAFTAVFSYIVGRKIRVGFDTRPQRSFLYTNLVPYSQRKYETQNFLQMLKALFPDYAIRQTPLPFISLSDSFISWGKKVIAHDKLIAICLSASIREKFWGIDNFRNLANFLIDRNYAIVFLGGKKEKGLFRAIFEGIVKKEYIFDFVGKTTLCQTAALIKSTKFYIGLDTGILHIAYALGVPTVSLFGPVDKDKWAPPGKEHIAICKGLTCSPCSLFGYTPHCKKLSCMNEIKVNDIILEIEELELIMKNE